ncbi:winged helix-turn-helix transcriptional regulator [Streptosporangium sp. NPDC000509]|uniref:winged helix-turn-helix transcriptional regulator n=1 Tax=Streptosporangium sp. NPDC000509 TaxID=3366186 RepID=UPI0036CC10C2
MPVPESLRTFDLAPRHLSLLAYLRYDGPSTVNRLAERLEVAPTAITLRGITPKVLTETLRAMERDGLMERTVYPEMPPRVEYELTSLGRTLHEPMVACCAWSQAHMPEILEAREA